MEDNCQKRCKNTQTEDDCKKRELSKRKKRDQKIADDRKTTSSDTSDLNNSKTVEKPLPSLVKLPREIRGENPKLVRLILQANTDENV